MAMTAWEAKVLAKRDLFFAEGTDLRPANRK